MFLSSLWMRSQDYSSWRERSRVPGTWRGGCCCCCVASVVSDSVRPHRRQPTSLPRPWDSPGKNTGVGCHCLLQRMKVNSGSEVAQSCPTLSDPMDCSPPGSSIHGIFQARVLEWGAIAFSSCLHLFLYAVYFFHVNSWHVNHNYFKFIIWELKNKRFNQFRDTYFVSTGYVFSCFSTNHVNFC